MSENLHFIKLEQGVVLPDLNTLEKDCEGNPIFLDDLGEWVKFPFQTPTDLTIAMMQLKTTLYRMWLLSGWLEDEGGRFYRSRKEKNAMLDKIESMLNDPNLILTY